MLQKLDDFLEFRLGFVLPRHVLERRLGVGLDIDLRFAAPDRHQPANAALALRYAPEPEVPNAEEHQRGNDPRQQRADEGVLHLAAEPHVVLFEFIGKLRRDARGHEALGAVLLRFLPVALDIVARNADLGDLAAFQVVEKLAVRNRNDVLAEAPQLRQKRHAQEGGDEIPGVPLLLFVHGPLPVRSQQPSQQNDAMAGSHPTRGPGRRKVQVSHLCGPRTRARGRRRNRPAPDRQPREYAARIGLTDTLANVDKA